TIIVNAPQLVLTKTAIATPVNSGEPIGYTITVSNAGVGTAYNVSLNDPLPAPAGVTWSNVTTTGPSGTPAATLSGNTVTDNLGTLAAGASVTFVVTGITAPGFSGALVNTATVTATN